MRCAQWSPSPRPLPGLARSRCSGPQAARRCGASERVAVASYSGYTSGTVSDDTDLEISVRRYNSPATPTATSSKVGVMLLNLGGPDTLQDVQPFLYNLFADPDIIRLPPAVQFLQPVIARLISSSRAPKSAEAYKSIGGGSPLRRITQQQADALGAALKARGLDSEVYVAMRYWHPYTEEAIEQLKKDNIQQLVVLPLYPQFSISTSGSSLRLLEEIFQTDAGLAGLQHTVIPSWYARKGYVTAMADLIQQELDKFRNQDEVEIFFSAHGVPKSYVEQAGDPYKEEMEECVGLIMQELQLRSVNNHHTLAYQSRVGPVEWLKPYTDESIRELAANGCKSLLAVPISFVSEHIETLEEIDMEYRELAEECGITNWGRVPALNVNQTFIDDLAEAVLEALPYVGAMIGSTDSLVPVGNVSSLLSVYDGERRQLPTPENLSWKPGWTVSSESWNGRIAMLSLMVIIVLEALTGRSVFGELFMSTMHPPF